MRGEEAETERGNKQGMKRLAWTGSGEGGGRGKRDKFRGRVGQGRVEGLVQVLGMPGT